MSRILLIIGLVAIAPACKSSETDTTKPPAKPAPKAVAPAAKPAAPISERQWRALLDAWLDAQNRGDFAAYEKLYARKLVGIKRVGTRTYRFARAGWLADRRRMFEKKMVVEARDPKPIATGTRSAIITFVQRWSSGTFEDLGPKRMMLVLEGGELKIAHEEMLRSEIVEPPAAGEGFYFMYGDGVVLHDAPVPDEHGAPVETPGSSDPITTTASVNDADLSPATLAWKGKKVRVDGACEATVTGFHLVSRVVPHFGYLQEWSCTFKEPGCVEATAAERAAAAFNLGAPRVVATLSGCGGGTFATPLESPVPIAAAEVNNPKLQSRALAAFARLERVTAQDTGDTKGWWRGHESVSMFEHPESGEILVSVHADNGGTCGEFSANHWQLWRSAKGKLVPLAGGSAPVSILQALDINRDGRLELIVEADSFGTEAALVDTRTLQLLATAGYVYNDCPC